MKPLVIPKSLPALRRAKPSRRLNRSFKICRVDAEQRIVEGIAATDQEATDGYIITKDAMLEAWPEYMKFGNIREMHQDIAAGVVRQWEMQEDGMHISVFVADDSTWNKVKTGVLKAFSVGCEAVQVIGKIVSKIFLYEISLVDRPADPGAVVTMFRAAARNGIHNRGSSPKEKTMSGKSREELVAGKPPAVGAVGVTRDDDMSDAAPGTVGGAAGSPQEEAEEVNIFGLLSQHLKAIEDLVSTLDEQHQDGGTTPQVLAHAQDAHRCLGRALIAHTKAMTAYDPEDGEETPEGLDNPVEAGDPEAKVEKDVPAVPPKRADAGRPGVSLLKRGSNRRVQELEARLAQLERRAPLTRSIRPDGYQPVVAGAQPVRTLEKAEDHVEISRKDPTDDGFPKQGTPEWNALPEAIRFERAAIRNKNQEPIFIGRKGA